MKKQKDAPALRVLKLGTVQFPALQYRVKIVVCADVEEYENTLDICCCDHSPEAAHYNNYQGSILAFHPFPNPGTVAHECWHAVRTMLLKVDAELGNEIVAYHLGYLVEKVSCMLHAHMPDMVSMADEQEGKP